jgi:hypothetical protein
VAKRVVEYLTSDLSGEEISTESAGGTVEFSISGTQYVVDLTEGELAEFNQVLAPYVDVAQKLTSRGARITKTVISSGQSGRRSKEQLTAVRSWAKKNGHQVSERGRIPEAVLAAFDSAH